MIETEHVAGIFSLHAPGEPLPLVFDSPHSGTAFPSDFRTALDHTLLLRTSDLFVGQLFEPAVRMRATLLEAHFPRAYIDVNRAVDDLDSALLAPGFDGPLDPGPKSALGKGLIWRLAAGGRDIYAARLSASAVRHRIDRYYAAYHDRLQRVSDGLYMRFGQVWHVNCHSMKSLSTDMDAEGAGKARADVVISDRDGASAEPAFVACAMEALQADGLNVVKNDPFKGAEIVRRYGRPKSGRHAIQIEFNRALYMNERTVQKHRGFDDLRQVIDRTVCRLADYCRSRI